jgi:hypothetical protein
MRIYTIYQGEGAPEEAGTILVKDGFAFWAVPFPWLWLLVKKMWLGFGLVLTATIMLSMLETTGLLNGQISFGLLLLLGLFTGLEGRNWQRSSLAKRGYQEVAVVAAPSLSEAEARWFAVAPKRAQNAPGLRSEVSP